LKAKTPLRSKTPLREVSDKRTRPGQCCGKKAFATEEAARAALERIRLVSDAEKVPQRVYECRHGWHHLTSQRDSSSANVPRATRDLIKLRDDWHCSVCGRVLFDGVEWSIHHRRNRGSGGSSKASINRPSNLLLVCGSALSLCHGDLTSNRDRGEYLAAGWVVSLNSAQDPAEVPVRHALFGLVLLDDEGGVEPYGRAAA
jgi:hypothetical protein